MNITELSGRRGQGSKRGEETRGEKGGMTLRPRRKIIAEDNRVEMKLGRQEAKEGKASEKGDEREKGVVTLRSRWLKLRSKGS